jgi:putative transposase
MVSFQTLHLVEHPFAGSRMLRNMLKLEGHHSGRKRVKCHMKKIEVEAPYRKPNHSRRHAKLPIDPYLLSDFKTDCLNYFWITDLSTDCWACSGVLIILGF